MSTATYKVVFRGKLVDGYSKDTVKSNLARAFKLAPPQLAELFSGKEVVVKSGLPVETARQVQSAFVRQGVVTLLQKVANGEATFADEVWELLSDLGHRAMSQLSILYRACVKRFPAVERHLESILPEELQERLASDVSQPAPVRRANGRGGRLPGKRQLRELSTKFLQRIPGCGGRVAEKRASPGPSTKPRRRGFMRLPRFGPILRRLKAAVVFTMLAAGVAGAVIYWPSDLQWTLIRAKLGLQPAQLELASRYQNGDGVVQDDARAVHWFWVAAERGHAGAQYELGTMYENGRGVAADFKLAATWYGMAAQQGQAQAQNKLGIMYQRGRGVEKDEAQAAYWYGKAATQGFAWAQANLGYLYESGRGVAKDPKLAALWYRKAAKQGHEAAQQRLKKL